MSLGEGVAVACAGRTEIACTTCTGGLVSTSGFDFVLNSSGADSSTSSSDLTSAAADVGSSGFDDSKTGSGVSRQVSGPVA